MNEGDYEQIKSVLKSYKDKKEEILKPLNLYREKVEKGENPPYFEDELISKVYSELDVCKERKEFIGLINRTSKDAEFEKYFRAAFFVIFHNRIVDPS